jgi:hypothetical protein
MFQKAVPHRVLTALDAPIPKNVHSDFAIINPNHCGQVVARELRAYLARSGLEDTSVMRVPETVLIPAKVSN